MTINTDALGRTFARLHNMPTAVAGYPSGLLLTTYHTYAPDQSTVIADTVYTAPAGGGTNTLLGKRLYVLGPGADERLAFADTNGTVYYPHADRQGSTIGLSTGGQNVLTLAYDAYGQPSQARPSPTSPLAPRPIPTSTPAKPTTRSYRPTTTRPASTPLQTDGSGRPTPSGRRMTLTSMPTLTTVHLMEQTQAANAPGRSALGDQAQILRELTQPRASLMLMERSPSNMEKSAA